MHHHLCRGIPPNLGDINRTRTTRPTPEPRIRQRECRRGDIRQRRRRSLRRRAMLNPCSPHGRDPCRRAMQEENDQSNRNPLKFGPHAPDHLPSTPVTCAPSLPSFAGVASPERRHVPAHRRRPLTPSTPAARSKLGIQGRRDDDDAAWLRLRLRRRAALTPSHRRHRRAPPAGKDLDRSRVHASTSAEVEPVMWALVRGGGHCSARGTPAYVLVRLETAATAAIYGAVQLQPANGREAEPQK